MLHYSSKTIELVVVWENSGIGLKNNEAALRYQAGEGVSDGGGGRIDIVAGNVNGKSFNYMDHVIPPETDNEKLYNFFATTS